MTAENQITPHHLARQPSSIQPPQLGYVDGRECMLENFIGPNDRVLVDFSVKHIDSDGHYLLQAADTDSGWHGCRQFAVEDGAAMVHDGAAGWVPFAEHSHRYNIIGRVVTLARA